MKHIFQSRLIAIVADSVSGRLYLDPSLHDEEIASLDKPKNAPDGELAFYPGCLNTRVYGLDTFDKLFTNRQLTALTTFSSLVKDAQDKASQDALAAGLANDGVPLEKQGKGAKAYGEAIGVYLAFLVDKMTDYHSTICIWHTTRDLVANGLRRQAIPMTWDYAEANPFSDSSGCFGNMIGWIKEVLEMLPLQDKLGSVVQWDATKDDVLRDIMVSTDPPYYDNIPYAYLADFFYIWMRASLKNTFPAIFSTLLTPKAEELTAVRYRFAGGKTEAKEFFEDGMSKTCRQIYEYSRTDIPVTIYYAFKQSESDDDGQASSGWETMLSAIINAGFAITGTWPIRTELTTALKKEMSALSTSVVIVCRKSDKPKQSISKKDFMDILQEELIGALRKLQASSIAPVDMAQSIIGPGIAVYSRYKSILQADGTAMTVRDALKLINNELDRLLNKSVGDLDAETAFCLTLFEDRAFNSMPFGQADTLARSKNTAVDKMARMDLLDSSKGQVSLKPREDLPPYDGRNTNVWLVTQQVVKEFALKGFEGAAGVFALLTASQSSQVKSMCYRLYSIADRKGWAQEALAYNSLISSWDITMDMTRTVKKNMKNEVQGNLDFGKGGND